LNYCAPYNRSGPFVLSLDVSPLDCSAAIELGLISAFLGMVNHPVSSEPAIRHLDSCGHDADPFSAAGALFFVCQSTGLDHRERLPGVAERLVSIQRADGGFGPYGTPGEFYL